MDAQRAARARELDCDSDSNDDHDKQQQQQQDPNAKPPAGRDESQSPSPLVVETAAESDDSAGADSDQLGQRPKGGAGAGAIDDSKRDKENRSGGCNQTGGEQCCFECKLSLTKSPHLINVDGRSHKWHPECFRCKVCSHQMDRDLSCHIYKDQLLCSNDYKRLKRDQAAAKCARCHWPILELDWVRRASKFVYHLACFSCDICSRQLNTGEQFVIDCSPASGHVRILCRLHFAVADQTQQAPQQPGQRSCYFRKTARPNANSVLDQQHLFASGSDDAAAEPSSRKSAADDTRRQPMGDSGPEPGAGGGGAGDEAEDSRRGVSYEPGSPVRSPISDPHYLHLIGGGASNAPAAPGRPQSQQRPHYDLDQQRPPPTVQAGEARSKRSHLVHSKHHLARPFLNAGAGMPAPSGPASPGPTPPAGNEPVNGNAAAAAAQAASESASLYERRSMNRTIPLVMPPIMSATHSPARLDQLINYQLAARDSSESTAAMDSNACNNSHLDQAELSSAPTNNPSHHQHHHHPHHHLALAAHELSNIGNSNCSTISNGSNGSSTGAQMMASSNNDNHNNNNSNKSKRVRTTFTEDQLVILQTHFQIDSNPDGQDLERIATITGLSKRVTQVWFQNSRARQKKYMTKRKPSGSLVTTAGIN